MNLDGLPLYKSNNISVWPILIKMINPYYVFPIAITLGKPNNHDFLIDSINELKTLMSDGFV